MVAVGVMYHETWLTRLASRIFFEVGGLCSGGGGGGGCYYDVSFAGKAPINAETPWIFAKTPLPCFRRSARGESVTARAMCD